MSDIAETYLVISLLMAVFAAVAAVGTALVLGVGFERLRNGFEIIRKQTAFFSDAIRKLDERADHLDVKTSAIEKHTVILDHRTSSLENNQNELAREIRERTENHMHVEKQEAVIREPKEFPGRYTEITGLSEGQPGNASFNSGLSFSNTSFATKRSIAPAGKETCEIHFH